MKIREEAPVENLLFNIAAIRKNSGESKKDFSKRMGISLRSLTMIEGGVLPHSLRVGVLCNICRELGVSADDLISKRI